MILAPGPTQESPTSNVVEMDSYADKIRTMQRLIQAPQTGRLDDATIEALKVWQKDMGLEATGYPNEETLAALKQMGGESALNLTWWDWAVIWALEYKWAVLGVGIGTVGGIGYWLWRRSKRRS